MEPLLEAVSLTRSFRQGGGELSVLRGIDLQICRGERVAVVGPSGAGKSTLLHIMGTLDRPTSGRVLFESDEIFKRSDVQLAAFRNREIGFVFQFHYLLPEFSALENASIPARIAGRDRTSAQTAAKKLLEAVGLGHRLDHRPGQLSGGEQQRVALARALVCEPKLLLADEPTGNLDVHTGNDVHQLLIDMNLQCGVTLVVATHNPDLAQRMDRVITIEDGRIVKDVKNCRS
jgi:lipoprotein-releasing system ATP-binding protein